MPTVHDGQSTVVQPRKQPRNTTKKETTLWADSPIKNLAIPVTIDNYNHYIGSVD